MNLEERLEKLERYHRRRWFRRAIKTGILIAGILLLLWLIMDALHLGMIVDALQRQVTDNNNMLHQIQSQVTNIQGVTDNLVVKVNGVIQSFTHNSTQLTTQPIAHNSAQNPLHRLSPVLASSAAGGIAGTIMSLVRVLSLAF